MTIITWIRKTWKVMSEWVRRKDADWRGFNECYTCGKTSHWKELHAGHFQHGKLDFDERNLRPQCTSCNTYSGGKLDNYTLRLIQENSFEWVEKLKSDASKETRLTVDQMKILHDELRDKIDVLP